METAEGSIAELTRVATGTSHEAVLGENFGQMLGYLLCTKTNGLCQKLKMKNSAEYILKIFFGFIHESGSIPCAN